MQYRVRPYIATLYCKQYWVTTLYCTLFFDIHPILHGQTVYCMSPSKQHKRGTLYCKCMKAAEREPILQCNIGFPVFLCIYAQQVQWLTFMACDRRYLINMSQFHLHYRIEPKEVKPWELDLWDIIIIHRVLIRIAGSRLRILNEKGS